MSKKIQKIVSITASVTTIAWMSGIAMLAPLAVNAAVAGIAEGALIKTAASPDVYIVKYVGAKQFKRLILSPSVFNSYKHLSWNNIKTVSQATMDSFVVSQLVRAEGDPKVYQLADVPNSDEGGKHWVNMTADAFTACTATNAAFDWDSVYQINTVDRDSYMPSTDDTTCTLAAPGVPSTGGALSVALAPDTPPAGLAPKLAARVPFTKINFTAGPSGATITGLTVQRTGLAVDAVISSVVLIDTTDNTQIGLSQTLNANHQAVFTETITIPANTTKGIMIAANMPSGTSYAGEAAVLSLVAVTTTSSLSGTLPIAGNYQTINATLSLGTATVTVGSLDPLTAATKEVGTTNYVFSAIKVSADSTEDLSVQSIRWNQSGSAASTDLANVRVVVNGVDYATTVSSDGKYYSVKFASGITIAKGLNKEFTLKGDILNGSNRTIAFDVYKTTDLVVQGQTYGYYLTPSFTSNGITHSSANATAISATTSPYFNGAHVTIGTGSLRIDKNTALAPAANVAKGTTGALLGAFDFVVQGEPINVTSMIMTIDMTQQTSNVGSSSDITSITLTKSDGTVIAGPVNGVDTGSTGGDGTATFSGTITLPVGTTNVLVKGNLNTDFTANDTIQMKFAVSTTNVVATGATTGNAITATPDSATVSANLMTVKGGALTVTVSGTPVSQPVVRGINGYTFTNFIFDASASGEDIRVTALKLRNTYSGTLAADQSNMALYDGTAALTTGSNVKNPTGDSPEDYTFTLDNPLVVAKNSQKIVSLKGNILGNATAGTTKWGLQTTETGTSYVTATGVSTGNAISVTTTVNLGPTMTVTTGGQYSVALDASTPAGKLIPANTTGNVMTVLKMKATSEDINIKKMSFFLANSSSTPNDIAQITVWDGSTLVASKLDPFAGLTAGTNATTTLDIMTNTDGSSALKLLSGVEKVVTVKADINPITQDSTIAHAGDNLIVQYDGSTSSTYNYGVGLSSGATITNYSPITTAQSAAYIYKSVPTVALASLPTTALVGGTQTLSKFTVAADAKGDIDLYKFTFKIATSGTVLVDNLTLTDETTGTILYASSTSFTTSAFASGIVDIVLLASPGTIGGTVTTRTVAAGTSKIFSLKATLSSVPSTTASISCQLEGDTAIPTARNNALQAATVVESDTNNDFIWSDFSASSHTKSTSDWTNGYLVAGLPTTNLDAQIISK